MFPSLTLYRMPVSIQQLQWEEMRELVLTDWAWSIVALKRTMKGSVTARRAGAPDGPVLKGKFVIHFTNPGLLVTHEHLLFSLNGHHVQWTSDEKACSLSVDESKSSGRVGWRRDIEIIHDGVRWEVTRSPKSGIFNNAVLADLKRDGDVVAVFRTMPTRTTWLTRKLKGWLEQPVMDSGYPRIFVEVHASSPRIMTFEDPVIALALVFRVIVRQRADLTLL
jgi:hypothetical protein